MTLDEAVAKIIQLFDCKEGEPQALAPTGEPYVEIMSGGLLGDGADRPPAIYATEELAADAWYNAVLLYGRWRGWRGATLYWRVMPEMSEIHIYLPTAENSYYPEKGLRRQIWYSVYSRLLISD